MDGFIYFPFPLNSGPRVSKHILNYTWNVVFVLISTVHCNCIIMALCCFHGDWQQDAAEGRHRWSTACWIAVCTADFWWNTVQICRFWVKTDAKYVQQFSVNCSQRLSVNHIEFIVVVKWNPPSYTVVSFTPVSTIDSIWRCCFFKKNKTKQILLSLQQTVEKWYPMWIWYLLNRCSKIWKRLQRHTWELLLLYVSVIK